MWIALVTGLVLALGAAAVFAHLWRKTRRELAESERLGQAATETEREQIAKLAVSNERGRIVREMHDVIAHSLAIMIAQADGGSYAVADKDAAKRAFTTIADTGRTALADTRRILGILRSGDAAELAPTPDEGALDDLIEQTRAAGLNVSLVRLGQPVPLPSAASLALYRICQEALTNVMKHGGEDAQVVITENWRADDVALTITNTSDTEAATTDGRGQGIIGMKERAEIVGGTLTAGPVAGVGFRVRAVIPVAAAPNSPDVGWRPKQEEAEDE
ncbi:MAG: histidine kinase [Propionibacteriaceae bacterium]|jgi:signal transduction histidine kinase|nr:histidine kinase [Propionibacteriaceae bacterium]